MLRRGCEFESLEYAAARSIKYLASPTHSEAIKMRSGLTESNITYMKSRVGVGVGVGVRLGEG